jgi:hypothetical protein
MSERCEPPPELRRVDGWHWLTRGEAKPFAEHWQPDRAGQDSEWGLGYFSPSAAHAAGYRYMAPVASPEEVAALRAENARLRAALAALMSQFGGTIAVSDSDPRAVQARAALEEPK